MNFIGLFLLTLTLLCFQQVQTNEIIFQYHLHSEQKHTLESLKKFNMFDVHFLDSNKIEVFGSKQDEEVFKRLGFNIIQSTPSRPFEEINPPAGYTKPSEILSTFKKLEESYPQLVQLIDLNAHYKIPKTIVTF
jgi:hypothetical protein